MENEEKVMGGEEKEDEKNLMNWIEFKLKWIKIEWRKRMTTK